MSPFEVLYGRKCSTHISWSNPIDRLMIGPKMLRDMELTVKQVQSNLKFSQDRHKSNADRNRTQREFVIGEHVFVKVKPRKSSIKLGSCAKLAPTYCGPFENLARVGPMVYHLTMPPNLNIHNVFHVSILKKYVHDATHVIDWNVI